MALITSTIASTFVKLTILTLYIRLFQPSRWAYRIIFAGIGMVIVFYLTTMTVLLALCVPSHNQTWLVKISSGSCPIAQVKVARAQGFFGLFCDLFILAIPLWQVSGLALALRKKAGIMVVFLTGLL